MRRLAVAAFVSVFTAIGYGQGTFQINGTPIPVELLQQNYGSLPKGIGAYDLSICNVTASKQSIVSSKIYQALAESNTPLQPIGRQIMLAAILRSQNRSKAAIFSMILNSLTGVYSVLGSSKYKVPLSALTAGAIVSLSGQQILTGLKPMLPADQVEKFETQVLEPALVLDGGSCVERTVFTANPAVAAGAAAKPRLRPESLTFHIQ